MVRINEVRVRERHTNANRNEPGVKGRVCVDRGRASRGPRQGKYVVIVMPTTRWAVWTARASWRPADLSLAHKRGHGARRVRHRPETPGQPRGSFHGTGFRDDGTYTPFSSVEDNRCARDKMGAVRSPPRVH